MLISLDYYLKLFTDLPSNINQIPDYKARKDFIHYFTKEKAELIKDISKLKKEIEPNGMIWISWPKRTSKIKTDVTEDVIREIALKNGLVDVKVLIWFNHSIKIIFHLQLQLLFQKKYFVYVLF